MNLDLYKTLLLCVPYWVLSLYVIVMGWLMSSMFIGGVSFFKNCAHPDEKQRLELGRRLGLESRQVKFWFQNRRTQLKVSGIVS